MPPFAVSVSEDDGPLRTLACAKPVKLTEGGLGAGAKLFTSVPPRFCATSEMVNGWPRVNDVGSANDLMTICEGACTVITADDTCGATSAAPVAESLPVAPALNR